MQPEHAQATHLQPNGARLSRAKAILLIVIEEETGGAVPPRFARDGHLACVTHRGLDKLGPLRRPIRDEGVLTVRFARNTRQEEEMIALVNQMRRSAAVSARL